MVKSSFGSGIDGSDCRALTWSSPMCVSCLSESEVILCVDQTGGEWSIRTNMIGG